MTVKEIIKKYLEDNKFDGLAGEDCGCSLGDLFPCDDVGNSVKCVASHKVGFCGCIGKHSDFCINME